jgi:hypothetical protein
MSRRGEEIVRPLHEVERVGERPAILRDGQREHQPLPDPLHCVERANIGRGSGLHLLAIALLVGGCSWLVNTDDLVGGGGDGGQTCSKDFRTDSNNCGGCGHSCLGGACMASACQPVTIAKDQMGPLGIAVSATQVFWVNRGRPALWRAEKDGKDPRRVDAAPEDGISDPFDIAVENDTVYWTELTQNIVFSKPLGGGPKDATVPGPGTAGYLAVEGGKVVLADHRPGGGIVINRMVLYPEMDTVSGLAVLEGAVFWARQSARKIMSGSLTSASQSTIVDTNGVVNGVAADGKTVYWVEDGLRVMRANRESGTMKTLYTATVPFGESDIAVDETAVYWTENATGLVRRLAKP